MTEAFSGPEKQGARDFLEEVKQTITNPSSRYDSWLLVKRKENVECITELGFTLNDVRDAILGLSVVDYCAGPLQDRVMPGDLWVFGKALQGREVYIKVKLARFGPVKIVRIVSFHFAGESLRYPFRPEEKRKGGT
ncbi:MAG: hypothetical protein R6V59_06180 [Dehalococcoidia bacterium]